MKKIVVDADINLQGFECIKTFPMVTNDKQFSTWIDEEVCSGCKVCNNICPSLHFDEERKIMNINKTSCKGCGVCVSICPSNALQQRQMDDGNVINLINGNYEVKPFDCKFCPVTIGYGKGDVRIFCSGRVEISHILDAILNGMNVFVIGCYYGDGFDERVREKIDVAEKLLALLGIKNSIKTLSSQEDLLDMLKME